MACGNCHTPRDADGKTIADKALFRRRPDVRRRRPSSPPRRTSRPIPKPGSEAGAMPRSSARWSRACVRITATSPACRWRRSCRPISTRRCCRTISTPSSPICAPSSRSATRSPEPVYKAPVHRDPYPDAEAGFTRRCLPIRSGAAPIWSPSAIAWNATPPGRAASRISRTGSAAAAGLSRARGRAGGNARQHRRQHHLRSRPPASAPGPIQEIGRAITKGIARDGQPLKPPMAYGYYAGLKPADLADIIAYLRTVPPLQ